MTVPVRRDGDPDDADYSGTRNGFAFSLPFNLGAFSGRGRIAITALVTVGFMMGSGALIYVNWVGFHELSRLLKESNDGHEAMRQSSDRLACVVSLSQAYRDVLRHTGNFESVCVWLRPQGRPQEDH